MEPPSNHLTSPYGSPPGCPPPMYGPNTDYSLQQKMQDQYYNDSRQQNAMGGGYPMSGQNYPTMGMEQSKMAADPSGFGGGAYGPMMRALTEDDLYNQQPQQAQYRQMPSMGGYGQTMNYPSQDAGYSAAGGGQYPFNPAHSPRNSAQFFPGPMHGQSDGYTSPPAVQGSHFGANASLGQYQRQSPLMNMGSPNGQTSPSVPPYSRPTNHPVSAPSPVMGMQGSNMYSSHTGSNSGHLGHNSPLPSPSNLRSPASVHSPKSLPATSPNTFASPSPSPVGTMAGQQTQHRQTRSPGASGTFQQQQNPGPQPYPIPSPKVRAVEQSSTVSGNTPYVELVSTRDSPHGSTTSNQSQDSGAGSAASGKAPYPPKETNRGHLPQLEEMVKFLGEPTAKGILYEKDNQTKEPPDINGRRNSVEDRVNNSVETDSYTAGENIESKVVLPMNPEAPVTSNGPLESPLASISEENTTMQNNTGDSLSNVPNNTQNGPDNPGKKSPRRRNSSKSPKRRNSAGLDSQPVVENHVGSSPRSVGSPRSTGSPRQLQTQTAESNGEAPAKRRRSSSGERGQRRRQSSGGSNSNQRSPKRRNSLRKSDDEAMSNEATSPKTRVMRSPRRHSLEKNNPVSETPNNGPNNDPSDIVNKEESDSSDNTRTESLPGNNPSNGAKSETGECEDNRTVEQKPQVPTSDTVKEEDVPLSDEKTIDMKSESIDTSPMDIPSTSRSVTPTFKNPMTTPTSKRNSPEEPLTPGGSKRRGRPPGSKNRTREEIERDKLQPRKKRPYKRRNIDPELKQELGKFKHVQKGGKVGDNKQNIQKGPVLRIHGTENNVISSKILNCPLDEHSSQNVVGKKQKKKPGRVPKRYSSMARAVPQGPATMHASVFRPVGDWVCALCGKPSNIGTLGHLYGPYYPHGYQIPPQPPKTDSTLQQTKDEVEELEVPPPSKKGGKGKGSLKS